MVPSTVEDAGSPNEGRQQTQIDPDSSYVEIRPVREKWVALVIMCLCRAAVDIDSGLLPFFFKEFQGRFGVSQTSLSTLTMTKGAVVALSAFVSGFLGERFNRPLLIGLGMLFWSVGLVLCSVAWSFDMIFIGRMLNGMALGVVEPVGWSLTAELTPPSKRGFAFGACRFVGVTCHALFGLVATSFATTTVFGVTGWRLAIQAVAVFSSLLAVAVMLLVADPSTRHLTDKSRKDVVSVFTNNMPKVLQLFRCPTLVLLLLQGPFNEAQWKVWAFLTQYLELSCFTHAQSGLIVSTFGWARGFAYLMSGYVLDWVVRRSPNRGPPVMANASKVICIVFSALIFLMLPKPAALGEGRSVLAGYMSTFVLFGLGVSLGPTVCSKILTDIVPPGLFTYVFAVELLVEDGLGSFAALLVGVVTDKVFHYDQHATWKGGCAPEEARKLGMGMFWVCTVAWSVCLCVYLMMHYTYPRDRQRPLQAMHAGAEPQREKPIGESTGGTA
uniref:Major facilitator superfamily (MFS) profile domain-containing protein n=1 Tax=Zooxanthella nutricula TaxID=1333877 RepID=A0A6U6NAR8_9DINO|mmetsp:Transcript_47120/g.143190  ORF Transcript_47120/g.143190 Transcript_47120/m.143190 type:complete len:499 (+) Transcript_47120:71-1567(+)